MSPIAIVVGLAIVVWGVIVVLTGLDVLHFEQGALASAGAVLVGLVTKAIGAMSAKKKAKKKNATKTGTALIVLALLIAGCPTTYTAPQGALAVAPYGDFGVTATLYVSTKEVCKLNAEHAKLKIHADTARRVCKAFPKRCTWK